MLLLRYSALLDRVPLELLVRTSFAFLIVSFCFLHLGVLGQQLWFVVFGLSACVCPGFRLFIILKTLICFIHAVILDNLPSCICLSAESYLLHSIKCWLFNVPWVWRDLEKLHFLPLWTPSSRSNVQRDLKSDSFRRRQW